MSMQEVSQATVRRQLHAESLVQLPVREAALNPANFNFVFFGDSWISTPTGNDVFERCLRVGLQADPLFMYYGGDLVFSGGASEYEQFFAIRDRVVETVNGKPLAARNIPMFVAIGNHDCIRDPVTFVLDPVNFLRYIGPTHLDLNIPRYRLSLIILDTMFNYVYNHYGLTNEELQFLAGSLDQRQPLTLVGTHVPPDEWEHGTAQFLRLIHGRVQTALFSHVHAYREATVDAVPYVLSGGAGATLDPGQVNHIVVFNVQGGRLSHRMVPV